MDITTKYMGLTLRSPIVPAASPLSKSLDGIRRMEDAGAPAITMYSLFEEQITLESMQLDHFLSYGTDSSAEALSYYPDMETYNVGPDEYLNLISKAKEATKIPVIGSLNGVSTGGWTAYAKNIQDAGADALELNVYYIATNPDMTGAEVEQRYVDVLTEVKKVVTIPVAMKIGPSFSSVANMAKQLAAAGADALVLFNRFYQPNIDLEELEVVPDLVLSTSSELRLPLRWAAILSGKVPCDLAITGGVHNYQDVLKSVMAGANIVQIAAELMVGGLGRLKEIEGEVVSWMEEKEYTSVQQMKGSMSQKNVKEPSAYERANYMKTLSSWSADPTGQALRD